MRAEMSVLAIALASLFFAPSPALYQRRPLLRQHSAFEGGLLGVAARVVLREERRDALVSLSGVPIGGRIEGTAWFGRDGQVKMDPSMQRALKRRLCAVLEVRAARNRKHVTVRLRVPVFGARTLVLHRVAL
jgi:hypothetical protein